jgi:hypothetical protein
MGADPHPGAERLDRIAGGLRAITRKHFDRQIAVNLGTTMNCCKP